MAFTLLIIIQGTCLAANLKPETVKAWDEYVQTARERLNSQEFLSLDR